jgi:HK97 family phage portal protein
MASIFDYFKGRQKPKKGALEFGDRQSRLFLERIGSVNHYDADLQTYIEKGYQKNPVVFSIVNMIAKNVAKAKWCAYNSKGEKIQSPLLSQLMYKPNPLQKFSDLTEAATTHYLLEGNSFITGEYGTGINSSKFNSMYMLPTSKLQVVSGNGRNISGFVMDNDNTVQEIPASDVMWMRAANPDFNQNDNWLFGQSPFRAALESIQIYNDAKASLLWFQQNKGAQKILINKDNEIEFSPEALDQLKNKLRKQAQGNNNTGNIPIIDANLDAIDVSSGLDALMLFEQLEQSAQDICNVLNFPSQLIGLKDSTYQNGKEARLALWENCVTPMLEELKNGLNAWLAPQFGDVWLDYDLSHIDAIQEGKLLRFKAIKEAAGMVTINEARSMANLPTINKIGDFTGEDMYVGFTQAIVKDDDEITDMNGQAPNQEGGKDKKDKPKKDDKK